MNLADPELELIDPTPNIYSLFTHFDELFFYTTLIGRALVRWSKRMYSCAGVCSYEGKNGLCDIALSEPLLKLRPRKDLIETLLHEMIHAYLFVTNKDNDRDGHGPNFRAHMHRINRAAGINISIYHDFHDEVNLYLRHWWRCNGKCQKMKPYFGVVRRFVNKAPGPSDDWWRAHQRTCGGIFIKVKEPEIKQKITKKPDKGKINADITKYIINNNDNTANKNITKPFNKGNKMVVNVTTVVPSLSSVENILKTTSDRRRTNSNSVVEKVRDVWKNKQISSALTVNVTVTAKPTNNLMTNKHKAKSIHTESPQKKIKKIDDYFKTTASNILKDVYGEEFIISQSNNSDKLKAVTVKGNACISEKNKPINIIDDLVTCPSCNSNVSSQDINRHLDECLNKDIIQSLNKELITGNKNEDKIKLVEIIETNVKVPNESNIAKTETAVKSETSVDLNKAKKTPNANRRHTDVYLPKTEKVTPLINKDIIESLSKESITRNRNEDKSKLRQIIETNVNVVNESNIVKTETCVKSETNVDLNKAKKTPNDGRRHTDFYVPKTENVTPFNTNAKAGPSTSKDGRLAQTCPCCGNKIYKPIEIHLNECLHFFDKDITIPDEGPTKTVVIKDEFKSEPGTSKEYPVVQKCPCCNQKVDKPIELHLDECLGFFNNDITIPHEGSTVETIVINDDEDDEFDETLTLNATGTKSPCPCCLKMIEIADMNDHLDLCLGT